MAAAGMTVLSPLPVLLSTLALIARNQNGAVKQAPTATEVKPARQAHVEKPAFQAEEANWSSALRVLQALKALPDPAAAPAQLDLLEQPDLQEQQVPLELAGVIGPTGTGTPSSLQSQINPNPQVVSALPVNMKFAIAAVLTGTQILDAPPPNFDTYTLVTPGLISGHFRFCNNKRLR